MLESVILPFIKSLPTWLFHVVEVLLVALAFSTAVIFLWGMVVGIRIIRGKRDRIQEITVFPPRITFRDNAPK